MSNTSKNNYESQQLLEKIFDLYQKIDTAEDEELEFITRKLQSINRSLRKGYIESYTKAMKQGVEAIINDVIERYEKSEVIKRTEKAPRQQVEAKSQETKSIKENGGGKDDKLNLLTAKQEEIREALKQVKVNIKAATAACKAIEYWKKAGEEITWEKLEKSTKAGKHKIDGFAKGTYQKLKEVADIRS